MIRVVVEYKLWLRDKIGVGREEYFIDKPLLTTLFKRIIERHPSIKKYLDNIFSLENPLIILVDGVPVNKDKILKNNCVVKIIPPVSGG